MTWLSRLLIPVGVADKMKLYDNYAWHKLSWQCFPNRPDAKRDFLTRLEQTGECFRLYLLSGFTSEKPEWCAPEWWSCKKVSSSFMEHDVYKFDLIANPTRKVHSFDTQGQRRKNSVRKAVIGEDALLAWLRDKADKHGFALYGQGLRIDQLGTQEFFKPQSNTHSEYRGKHVGVRFQGMLKVKEHNVFQEAFINGIGSARAFGFGLLMLAPA
jgi:CRISPR system Cascade subunit CasE